MGIAARQIMQRKWLGLDTRSDQADVIPLRFTELKNFNPFKKPGKIIPDKGYVKKFTDSNSGVQLLGSFRRNNGDVVTVANDGDSLYYWVNNSGSKTLIFSASGFVSNSYRRAINDNGVLRISGYKQNFIFPNMNAWGPKWMGYIERTRFSSVSNEQVIDQYYISQKGLEEPELVATGLADEYKVTLNLTGSGSGSGLPASTYYYKLSFIYDGFQESAISTTKSTFSAGTYDSIDLQLEINENINKRITGINIYRSTDDNDYYFYDFVNLDAHGVFNVVTFTYSSGIYTSSSGIDSDTGGVLTELYENRIDYPVTKNINPFYKYGLIFREQMYAAGVIYSSANFWQHDELNNPRMLVISPPFQYDVLPETRFVTFPDEITGLAKTRNHVIVFTRNDMFLIDEFQIRETKSWRGCWSFDSIAGNEDVVCWANRSGIWLYDGLRVINISDEALKSDFSNLTDEQVKSSIGVIDTSEREYYFFIKNQPTVWVYSIEMGEWRKRDMAMQVVTNDINGKLIASDGTYILNLLEGYDYDGTAYECSLQTGEFELEPAGEFELIRLWAKYIAVNGGLSAQVLINNVVKKTVSFPASSNNTRASRSLVGYGANNSIYGNDMKVRMTLTSPSDQDQINSIAIDYNPVSLY